MDFSKATTVVLCCTVLFCGGISGLCNINLAAFTADCSYQDLDKVPSYVPDSTKVLNLTGNWFNEVNPRQFRRFCNLVELDLRWNYIAHLNNDSDTELSTLRVLDISYNRGLQDLNSAFFASIPNLQWLSIRSNYLVVSMFKGLRNLTYLDMSFNKPISVNSTPFMELEYLEDLNLSGCRLQNLSDTMFTGLSNLLMLNLRNNFLHHLPSRVFVRLTKLKVLDLSYTKLDHLPSGVFVRLTKLKDLDLSNNNLDHLPSGVFFRLTKLEVLYLSSNDLDHLPSGIFVGLTKLNVLDLSNNRLFYSTSLPTDIFQPLIHLEQLKLFMGDIPHDVNYTYMDNPISKVPSLKQLYITGAPNTNFGHGYSSLKNLEYLKISGNLSEINNETFFNLRYTRSLTLSLVWCELSSISRNAFSSLINLTSLDISGSLFLCKDTMWTNFKAAVCNSRVKNLIAINICTFDVMPWVDCSQPYLEYLDMSHNNLPEIPFVPESLKELILTNNNIEDISSVALSLMYNLEKLDLSDQTPHSTYTNAHLKRDIKRTTRDSTGQYQLYTAASVPLYNTTTTIYKHLNKTAQTVKFKDRNMTFKDQVRNMTFNDQARNMTFKDQAKNMTFNDQGRNMTFKSQGLSSETRFTLQSWPPIPPFLEWLDVSKSGLICSLFKYDYTNNFIRSLNISKFRSIKDCSKWLKGLWPWLDKLTHLEDLDLSDNKIAEIPALAFTHTTHLKHLYLSDNSLFTLTFEIKSLVNLKEIYLSNNIIQYASSQFTTGISSNDLKIYLDGNYYLLCDCRRLSFVKWLSTTYVVYNIAELMCKYENETQVNLRHRVKIYQQLKDECIYVLVTVSCVIYFIVLLIGGSVVAILLHKRWREQYLSVFGRRSVNPYHPLEMCQIELEYDIYISYERDHDISAHKSMHDFVTKELYPWLKRKGFKVLIRDELHAGRKLYSEISEALRKTRNVVVLLSNDYCADFWNVFEFNVAAMEGIYTKRQVIIPITFEILKPELFHEEINAFLKSGPLPRYTPNTKFSVLADFLLEQLASLGNL